MWSTKSASDALSLERLSSDGTKVETLERYSGGYIDRLVPYEDRVFFVRRTNTKSSVERLDDDGTILSLVPSTAARPEVVIDEHGLFFSRAQSGNAALGTSEVVPQDIVAAPLSLAGSDTHVFISERDGIQRIAKADVR